MTRVWILIVACAGALSACAETIEQTNTSSTTIPVTVPATRGTEVINTVTYDCAGGTSLTVSFNDTAGNVTVTPSGGAPVTLPQHAMPDASFGYSDAGHSLSGKHDDATWVVGGASVKCKTR